MEGRGKAKETGARTTAELAIEVWDHLGPAKVGRRELLKIQRAIANRFGAGAVDSPASIARLLADQGAELRHPEVIEFDAEWRQSQIEKRAADFSVFDRINDARPMRLPRAESLIRKLEKVRLKLESAGDQAGLRTWRDEAVSARNRVSSLAAGEKLSQRAGAEQLEVVEWLSVWIRTPKLFEAWLELRKRSPEFRERFPAKESHRDAEARSNMRASKEE